jgi:toxin CptA
LSSESSNCRIDWRPSALLCRALLGLGMLAALSLCLSALPLAVRLPLALIALGHGGWLARREALRPACWLQLDAEGSGLALVYADRVERLSQRQVHLRGPMARVSGVAGDGRRRHLLWWPDTLDAASRRRLRLAAGKSIEESGPALATMPG